MSYSIHPSRVAETAENVLWTLSVDDLKSVAKLFRRPVPKRKPDLIIAISAELEEQRLRAHYERLNEIDQAAVAEAVHDPDGRHRAERFTAKYGRQPDWTPKSYARLGEETAPLCLFFCGRDRIPADLRERLLAFVPTPPETRVGSTGDPPELLEREITEYDWKTRKRRTIVESIPIARRENERSAIHDIAAVLRLVDAGKLSVSDKTRRPTAATVRAIGSVLQGGDFYPDTERREKSSRGATAFPTERRPTPAGPIKAYAWPIILQVAGLAKPSGTRLKLTKRGRELLERSPVEALMAAWEGWELNCEYDELLRVEAIKGQTGRGKRSMTEPEDRRICVTAALSECPPGQWILLDELFRYIRASQHDFEITDNAWHLYISDAQYGSLGYQGYAEWSILQGRYVLCVLFEFAATLGAVDVAFVPPNGARGDFRGNWGTDDLEFLSRYDGLLYFRITPLGAFFLDIVEEYSPPTLDAKPVFRTLPNLEVVALEESPSPADTLAIETFATPVSERRWRLEAKKILAAIETGHSVGELRELLTARGSAAPPESVVRLLDDLESRSTMVRDRGKARLYECSDAFLAALIANDSKTRKHCLLAGERHLVSPQKSDSSFRRGLRELGYAVSAVTGTIARDS